jgi:hypothetical protein
MISGVTDIQQGMDVFGADGQKIGSVSEVYRDVGAGTAGTYGTPTGTSDIVTEEVTTTPTGTPGGTFAETTTSTGATSPGYFKVDQGGILGIGAKELYIPFSAVSTVVPGENVTVSCTKDECGTRFGTKPAFLEGDNTGDQLV